MKRRATERMWRVNSLLAVGGVAFAAWMVFGHKPMKAEANPREPASATASTEEDVSAIWEARLHIVEPPPPPPKPDPHFEVAGRLQDAIGLKADGQPLDIAHVGDRLSIDINGAEVRVKSLDDQDVVLEVEEEVPRDIRVPLFP